MNRTKIDFSKHEVLITDTEELKVWHLKKPDTYMDSIMFINTNGILAVTGDYSNWIFCREFHPSAKGGASTGYWREKLQISSCQEPMKYDSEKTAARIEEMLKDEEWSEESKEYLESILTDTDDELTYTYRAYREMPNGWDYESVPFEKSFNYHFLAVLDGFDELCERMAKAELVTPSIEAPN